MNKEAGTQAYLKPLLSQLTLQPARSYISKHAREFLQMISRKRNQEADQLSTARSYEPPRLTKLTPEQAKLRLLGQLSVGHKGARELLDVLFPEPDAADTALQSTEGKLAMRGTG